MNAYEFNMSVLKQNYPDLAKALDEMKDDGSVRVVTTKNPNHPSAIVKSGDKEWLLHTKEDPIKEAFTYVDTVLKREVEYANIVVLLGIGMGYHLEPLIARYSQMNTLFIVVENNLQLFKTFIKNNRPLINFQGQVFSLFNYPSCRLMVGVHPKQIYNTMFEFMMKTGRNSHSTFQFVEHPVLIRFNKEYYKPIIQEMQRVCYDIRSSYGNDPEDSWIGIDHMLQNLDQIISKPGIIQAEGAFKDVPAVIVATGPSLNKNIDLLPEIKDKAVFFAADASVNTFLKHEPKIIPDIVCSLERNLTTKNHFEQIEDKSLMKDIWLCGCPVVMPDVYNAWKGKDVTLYRDFAHFSWLGVDKGKLNTGKSVTNMAFKAALYLGCNPIILVGQDLAFAPDGQTHVKGADHARDGLKKSQLIQQKVKVMGNNGEMIDSLDTWVGMLKRFEYDIAKECKDRTIINATEGGAKIEGTEVMPLREVIDKYITKDANVHDKLNHLFVYPDQFQQELDRSIIEQNIQKGIDYLSDSILLMEETIETLEEACLVMGGEITDQETQDIFNYCDKVRQKILTDKMCYLTAMHVIQSWCIGRENIFYAIPQYYKKKEMWVDRLIKMFEFFYGLRKLYRMMRDGVEKDYTKWKEVQKVSGSPDEGELKPIEREQEGLDMYDLQPVDNEGNKGHDYSI